MSKSGNHGRVDGSERLLNVIVELLLVELLHRAGNHPLVEVSLGDRPHLLMATKNQKEGLANRNRHRMEEGGKDGEGWASTGWSAQVEQQQDR